MVKWWNHISFTIIYEHRNVVLNLKAPRLSRIINSLRFLVENEAYGIIFSQILTYPWSMWQNNIIFHLKKLFWMWSRTSAIIKIVLCTLQKKLPCLFLLLLYLRCKVVGPRIIHTDKSTEKLHFIVVEHQNPAKIG